MKSKQGRGINPPPASNRKSAHIWYDPKQLANSNDLVPMFACSYPAGTSYNIRVPALRPLVDSLLSEGFSLSLCPEAKLHLAVDTNPLPTAIGGKRLAVLTPEEASSYRVIQSMIAQDDSGKSEEEDALTAWNELQRAFPRLKSFDGCKP